MKINGKTGLVLEGGGMRGVFTSGVLDAFMKHNLYFKYIVAVSAGAFNPAVRVFRTLIIWPVTATLDCVTSSLRVVSSTKSCSTTSFPMSFYHLISMNISNILKVLKWSQQTV